MIGDSGLVEHRKADKGGDELVGHLGTVAGVGARSLMFISVPQHWI
jgi:hypothetical protein